jgi:hypothetical protein
MIPNETHPEKPLHPGNDPRQNSSKLVKTRQNREKFVCLEWLKKLTFSGKRARPNPSTMKKSFSMDVYAFSRQARKIIRPGCRPVRGGYSLPYFEGVARFSRLGSG